MNAIELSAGLRASSQPVSAPSLSADRPAAPPVDRITLSGARGAHAASTGSAVLPGTGEGEPTDPDRRGPASPGDHEGTRRISYYA